MATPGKENSPALPTLTAEQVRELYYRDREQFYALQRMAHELQIKMARTNINAFVAYVMRAERPEPGEKVGRKLKQAPSHIEMQRIIDEHQKTVIWGALGVGKAIRYDSRVLTPSGWVQINQLKEGDTVVDPDGGTGWVTGVFPQGVRRMYEVKTSDGGVVRCDKNHLWTLQSKDQRSRGRGNSWTMPLKAFMGNLHVEKLHKGERHMQARWFLPITKPVELTGGKPLILHPWVIGAIIGDGTVAGSVSYSKPDQYIRRRFRGLIPESCRVVIYNKERGAHGISARPGQKNDVLIALRRLGLGGKRSWEKKIPKRYMKASPADRMELLRGLMDTDGDVSKSGNYACFNTSSPFLRDQVVELVRGLGGFTTVNTRIPKYDHNGEKKAGREAYRVNIRLPENPFSMPRKANRWRKPYMARSIDSVTRVEKAEAICIAVSTKRNLFITDDHIVTHNCVTNSTTFTLEDGREVTTPQLKALVDDGLPVDVWTIDHDTFLPVLVRVKSVTYNGKVKCKIVHTASGHSTFVSGNHPFRALSADDGWGWPEAKDIRASNHGSTRLVVHGGTLSYSRPKSLDKQEAFDLGFMLSLLHLSGDRLVVEDSKLHLDVARISINKNSPSVSRIPAVMLELVAIANRRGLHIEATIHAETAYFEVFGLCKWLNQYGKGTTYWQRKGAKSKSVAVTGSGPVMLIDDIHAYDEESCAAYLAGAYAVMASDSEDRNIGCVLPPINRASRPSYRRPIQALIRLGHLAGVRSRRWRGKVHFESRKIVEVAASIGGFAPRLKAYFDGVASQLSTDFRCTKPAEQTAESKLKYFSVMNTWAPREEQGVFLSPVTRTRWGRFPKDTWAVEIDNELHTHLTDGILTHNTQQISIARSLFTLGNNTNARILIVQSTADLAKDILSMIKKMIEESPELHEVFPDLVPGDLWQAREIKIKRTNPVLTPSVRAIGAETQIDGSRYDFIIIDDSLSFKNTRSKPERDNHFAWLVSVPFSREEDWTTTVVIANAWSADDALHRLAKMEGWYARKFPARDPVTGITLLPDRWPQERIERWIKSRPPAEVRRTLDCFPAGTLILTRTGYVAIEKVRVGDKVLTHLGRWRAVTSTMCTRKRLMTITGHGHPALVVSKEHPFYVRERGKKLIAGTRNYSPLLHSPTWKNASSLGKGDYWATPISFPPEPIPAVTVYGERTLQIDEALMWLAGRYLADGWIGVRNGAYSIVITCGHAKTEALRARLQVWKRKGKRATTEEMVWHERDTGTAHQFITTFRGLAEWLLEYFGKGASRKKIPGWALGMPEASRRALLDGYLSGDGYRDKKRGTTEATTVSKALAFGMKAVANSLGYTVTVRTSSGGPAIIQGRHVNTLPQWHLVWRSGPLLRKQTWHSYLHEWTPIRSSAKSNANADVFNLSVKGDESYVVEGIIVHNCEPFSNATSRFDSEWFDVALKKGIDILKDADGKPVHFLLHYDLSKERGLVERRRKEAVERGEDPMKIPMPVQVSAGCDLGFGLSEDADFTVVFTAVFFDSGDCMLIHIDKGRYGATEIIPRIINTHKKYGATIFVEAMFTQKWVYDTIHEKFPDIPVYPWKTDGKGTIGNKWDMIFGIESVAFDIGTGRWILPCLSIPNPTEDLAYEVHELVLQFKEACLLYVPDSAIHTADELVAAWIMLQGARLRGSQEYLVALSEIGSMYNEWREDGIDYIEGESSEKRWGRTLKREMDQLLEDQGLGGAWPAG